jgi:two-component system chemotaxis sensor kinase CheA
MEAEIIEGFQQESFDLLEEVEPKLINLAENANQDVALDLNEINAIFRTFHTIKGCAASIGLDLLTKIAHEAESILDLFREDDYQYRSEYTEILCESTDLLRSIIEKVQSDDHEDEFKDIAADLISRLKSQFLEIKCGEDDSNHKEVEQHPRSESKNIENDQSKFLPDDRDQEMISQFISDGYDFLSNVESSLISLQDNPNQEDLVQYAYRQMHSFKGNCSLMDFLDLEKLGHAIESTLSYYRDEKKGISSESPALCLKFIDILRDGLRDLEKGLVPYIDNIEVLIDLLNDNLPKRASSINNAIDSSIHDNNNMKTSKEEAIAKQPERSIEKEVEQETVLIVEDSMLSRKKIKGLLESENYQIIEASDGIEALEMLRSEEVPNCDLVITDLGMPRMDGNDLVRIINNEFKELPVVILSGAEDVNIFKKLIGHDLSGYVSKNVPKNELFAMVKKAIRDGTKRKLLSTAFNTGEAKDSSIKARNDIRVDMRKLDTMINLVGELIIAEALVTANPEVTKLKIASFEKYSTQLRGIIGELHDVTLSLRMVPVEGLFKKMIRVVHDASKKTDKKIKLETFGEDTELDKLVTDVLSDPLVHMIRNSVDHGIEKPDSRLRKKKSEQGTIKLGAEQKGNEVTISIHDDGGGLNRDKILEKAVSKSLVDQNAANNMSDDDVYQIIFNPGFSTAETVTDISGRGVGMDVVKKNIESVNGKIDIKSDEDIGSTFKIRIPLNLATMEGMLFQVGESKYTIPISCIRESFRLEGETVSIRSDNMEYVNLRDEILPILRLHEIHDIIPASNDLRDGILIVLDVSDGIFCLFVDEMLYQMDTVIKNFSGYIDNLPTICGCNILGDGKISLILNTDNIVKMFKSKTLQLKINRS